MFTNNYEPTKFDDLVFQNDIARKRLERHALGEAKGNILLYGPSGSAKSTTARIIANQARKQVDFGFELPVDVVN
jgi:replication-associated recombination protein RarA